MTTEIGIEKPEELSKYGDVDPFDIGLLSTYGWLSWVGVNPVNPIITDDSIINLLIEQFRRPYIVGSVPI